MPETKSSMAGQARTYDKNVPYSSRQVDEKFIHKGHLANGTINYESSPYHNKPTNYYSSPNGRKRPYDSPSSTSSRHSSSPYESSRKKEKLKSLNKNKEVTLPNCEWSQHTSSSGKIYYYNRKTEESQWEVPKEWQEKLKEQQKIRVSSPKDSRLTREIHDEKSKDLSKSYKLPPDKTRELRDNKDNDFRNYKDSRTIRDRNSRELYESPRSERDRERNRDRLRECDRDFRSSKDYPDKYRAGLSASQRDSRYNGSSIRTVGQSTPSIKTSLKRSSVVTPDHVNGSDSVQDISPPGTPTNDDIMNISGVSPAPIFTPHGCSPLVNNSFSNTHTPLLSPIIVSSSGQLPTPFLHPLQQALLLHQQKVNPMPLVGSPKLPTVKNSTSDSGSASSSPKITSSYFYKSHNSSPGQSWRNTENAIPPPPPPPIKDQRCTEAREKQSKLNRYSRTNSSFDSRNDVDTRHLQEHTSNRIKSRDDRSNENPSKSYYTTTATTTNNKNDDSRTSENSLTISQKQLQKLSEDNDVLFSLLPDLDKYVSDYSSGINDFTNGFYGNMLERQVITAWEETMHYLHGDGCQSKSALQISRQERDTLEVKHDVAENWSVALDTVLQKVESLRDSSMKSETRTRDQKSSPYLNRTKSKDLEHTAITQVNTSTDSPNVNGVVSNGESRPLESNLQKDS